MTRQRAAMLLLCSGVLAACESSPAGQGAAPDSAGVQDTNSARTACIAAVAVHAIGKDKVVGLILPEKESNPISSEYAIKHAQILGIEHRQIDITNTVDRECRIGIFPVKKEANREILEICCIVLLYLARRGLFSCRGGKCI